MCAQSSLTQIPCMGVCASSGQYIIMATSMAPILMQILTHAWYGIRCNRMLLTLSLHSHSTSAMRACTATSCTPLAMTSNGHQVTQWRRSVARRACVLLHDEPADLSQGGAGSHVGGTMDAYLRHQFSHLQHGSIKPRSTSPPQDAKDAHRYRASARASPDSTRDVQRSAMCRHWRGGDVDISEAGRLAQGREWLSHSAMPQTHTCMHAHGSSATITPPRRVPGAC